METTIDRSPDTMPAGDLDALRRGVCVLFSTSLLGVRKKVRAGELLARRAPAAEGDTDPDASFIHVQKTLLESEALDALRKRDTEIREQLIARTVGPAVFRDGIYLIPLVLLRDTDAFLSEYVENERPLRVETFLDEYELARDAAAAKLGDLFNPMDYPTKEEARAKFSARVQFLAFGAPNQIAAIAPDIYEREQEKIATEMRATLDECRAAIRTEFAELVTHLADRLDTDATGKRKILRDSAVTKITEWLDLFEARNTIGRDEQLAGLVANVRDIMAGVRPDDLRGSRLVRERIRTEMQKASQLVGELVDVAPARAFQFD